MKQILFTAINKAELLEVPAIAPREDEVVVKTMVSTVSCGTEKANLTGSTSVCGVSPEEDVPHYPRYPGYSSAGVIVEKGSAVKNFDVGDRVVVFNGHHKQFNTVPEYNLVRMDDGITFSEAAIMYIGTFPLAGIRKTRLEIGEPVMVMGLGLLGQLAVQYARAAGGAPVIAADPVPQRREAAIRRGADYALDPTAEGFAERVKALTGGGVHAAIEVTGVGAGLDETLDCMAKFGRIALLGCTRNSHFEIDYYRKVHCMGITLIGAHTDARPRYESYPAYFTHHDDIRCLMRMCRMGRIDLKQMVAETRSPEDAPEVYTRLATDPNFPVTVQFDWTRL